MKYFVANWKGNKNVEEASYWISEFNATLEKNSRIEEKLIRGEVKIIIAPPHALFYLLKTLVVALPNITIGAQDISVYGEGSYTGEPIAKSMQGLVSHVILGHSERRHYLGESEEHIETKITRAQEYGIEPILCFRGPPDKIYKDAPFVAYDPPAAIGTGNNEPLEKILAVKANLNLSTEVGFFYGGSVNKANISSYISSSEIQGFLVGGASLDPHDFFDIVAQV